MNKTIKNLKNRRFGRLIAIKSTDKRYRGHVIWIAQCDCGNLIEVIGSSLTTGNTRSCGCIRKERGKRIMTESNYKHGGTGTRLYRIWKNIKIRCFNQSHKAYPRYGGRGIIICPEWKNNFSLFRIWALANGYQNNLSIDRIDNDGDYCPENCQWITRSENIKKYWKKI